MKTANKTAPLLILLTALLCFAWPAAALDFGLVLVQEARTSNESAGADAAFSYTPVASPWVSGPLGKSFSLYLSAGVGFDFTADSDGAADWRDPPALPDVASIRASAFVSTGTTPLTVTLGATVPELGEGIFVSVDSPKTVTVKIPVGASAWTDIGVDDGATTSNWRGNGFRGGGWDGANMTNSSVVNSNITVTIEQPDYLVVSDTGSNITGNGSEVDAVFQVGGGLKRNTDANETVRLDSASPVREVAGSDESRAPHLRTLDRLQSRRTI